MKKSLIFTITFGLIIYSFVGTFGYLLFHNNTIQLTKSSISGIILLSNYNGSNLMKTVHIIIIKINSFFYKYLLKVNILFILTISICIPTTLIPAKNAFLSIIYPNEDKDGTLKHFLLTLSF